MSVGIDREPRESDLWAALNEGLQQLERGEPGIACHTFQRLVACALEPAAGRTDHEHLPEALQQAVRGLERCLKALQEDPMARQEVFQSLFQVYQADVRHGANGLMQDIPFIMLQNATPAERLELVARVRQALAAEGDGDLVEAYWRLLLDLATLDPATLESLLADCLAAGYPALVAEKLLDLERVGEALILVRERVADTAAFLSFANSPAARTQMPAIMALAEERLSQRFDAPLADWLAARYAERGDLARGLELRLRLLREAPGRGDYGAAHALAQRLGIWEKLQPDLRRQLEHSQREEALAEIALDEGDLEQVLQHLARAPERYSPDFVARVAALAAAERLEQTASLYRSLVERLLAQASSDACRKAAGYLACLQPVYERHGRTREWQAYLADLQARHAGRPAFHRALRQAGL